MSWAEDETGERAGPVAIALTIAGSDPSGGAGIQADLKTFSALGVYGASVLTALTAQNTRGVVGIFGVPTSFVAAQIEAVTSDLDVKAVKTGMLANAAIVETVAESLARLPGVPFVCDPVMVATSGDLLLEPAAIGAYREQLIPRATLITPNLPEAARLLGGAEAAGFDEMAAQAKALLSLGCKAVLIKGGHGTGKTAVDILASGAGVKRLEAPRVDTPHTHGTGCTLSAAITALLAEGVGLEHAVERGKTFVWRALKSGIRLRVGQGHGPVDHLFSIRRPPV
jgi:hydroxymethylpyrimidine/phosphomethylpyrimidine kinase